MIGMTFTAEPRRLHRHAAACDDGARACAASATHIANATLASGAFGATKHAALISGMAQRFRTDSAGTVTGCADHARTSSGMLHTIATAYVDADAAAAADQRRASAPLGQPGRALTQDQTGHGGSASGGGGSMSITTSAYP